MPESDNQIAIQLIMENYIRFIANDISVDAALVTKRRSF